MLCGGCYRRYRFHTRCSCRRFPDPGISETVLVSRLFNLLRCFLHFILLIVFLLYSTGIFGEKANREKYEGRENEERYQKRNTILTIILIGIIFAYMLILQLNSASHSYAISIIERSAIYAVVAVAMNMLTGFTGLFSLLSRVLWQSGAYVTAILIIPVNPVLQCIMLME